MLVARIRAILRRTELVRDEAEAQPDDADGGETIQRGRLEMDPVRHRVAWDGELVSLTVTEFLILEASCTHFGCIPQGMKATDAS